VNIATVADLSKAARDLAFEIREGRWRHVLEQGTESASTCEEIIAELRSRHPGLERSAYEKVLVDALSEYRPTPWHETLSFWFVGSTSIWAFFVVNPLVKRFAPVRDGWIGLLAYPLVCVAAACYLGRKKRSGHLILAMINVASGFAWIVFVVWAVRAFAKSFWR
jgi:hypothetical protein